MYTYIYTHLDHGLSWPQEAPRPSKRAPPAKLGHEFWRGLGPPDPPKSNINQHKINQKNNDFLK